MRGRSGVRALATLLGGAMLVSLAGCGSQGAADRATPGADSGASQGSESPPLAEYASIPLPTSSPPPGAIVTTANYGDPDASGQDIAFQYQGFTIQACWRDTALARPDACLPQQGVSTFRTVRNGTADTRFTVSTKNLADLPAEAGPIVRFFETAELAVRPSWLPDYVAREFAKLVGE